MPRVARGSDGDAGEEAAVPAAGEAAEAEAGGGFLAKRLQRLRYRLRRDGAVQQQGKRERSGERRE